MRELNQIRHFPTKDKNIMIQIMYDEAVNMCENMRRDDSENDGESNVNSKVSPI